MIDHRWLHFLPESIRIRFEGRHVLQKIIGNTGWLVFDKILRLCVGLVVGAWVARYLGPAQFGLWSYVLAFTALFGTFASLGLDSIVVRELVRSPEKSHEILGTAYGLKLAGGGFTMLLTLLVISFLRPEDPLAVWLVALSSAGFIFQSFNIIDLYYQAHIQSKYTVCAANLSFVLVTIVKIALIVNKAPLIAFACVGLSEIVLTSTFLLVTCFFSGLNLRRLSFKRNLALKLLTDSWPLIFSGLAVMIYMRIDQIMIGQMLGDVQVGIFSAAVRISEVWYFIPVSIASSVFPVIISKKGQNEGLYQQSLQTLFDVMAFLGLGASLILTFASPYVMQWLYGASYAAAAKILSIHVWSGIFVSLGVASGSWLAAENLQSFSLYRTVAGGAVNVLLNLILIPKYGIIGAAYSTLISYGVAAFCLVFFQRTGKCGFMMLLAFLPCKKFLLNRS